MDRPELAKGIAAASRLTGEFRLRSGATSTVYWDKYRFESDPKLLQPIARDLATLLPSGTRLIAGLEMGGIPVATALSLATGIHCLFVRKAAKGYGTMRVVEGAFNAGQVAVVVEDVVTSGGQIVSSVADMRSVGLQVSDVVCVVDREQGGVDRLREQGLRLKSLFTQSELERYSSAG